MWNRQIAELFSMPDQFIENSISAALGAVVTDSALIPDIYDVDLDKKFGLDASSEPLDETSRFGFYYSARINGYKDYILTQQAQNITEQEIQDFQNALRDLLYSTAGSPTNAIYDPGACPSNGASFASAVCLDYCTSPTLDQYGNELYASQCLNKSPYRNSSRPIHYPYDPFSENMENNTGSTSLISFREALGRDDENKYYTKSSANPNGVQTYQSAMVNRKFRIEDTTGYYSADKKKGIFSFFYKLADWGVGLNALNPGTQTGQYREHCYWYASAYYSGCSGVPTPQGTPLTLPVNPNTLTYNTNPFVDGINSMPNRPPLAVDKVVVPNNILAGESVCADLDPTTGQLRSSVGFWKRGSDRFCSEPDPASSDPGPTYPYDMNCPKHNSWGCTSATCPSSCSDPGTNKTQWRDDALDNMTYGIHSFMRWALSTLDMNTSYIVDNFEEWYDEESDGAWQWIEQTTGGGACFICNDYGDYRDALSLAQQNFQTMRDRINALLTTDYTSSNTTYGDVWCPPHQNNSYAQTDEKNASSGSGLTKVINCLDHNINKSAPIANPNRTGNAGRFLQCHAFCDVLRNADGSMKISALRIGDNRKNADRACGADVSPYERGFLPRSLVPNFNPSVVYESAKFGPDPSTGSYIDYPEPPEDELPDFSNRACYDTALMNQIETTYPGTQGGPECRDSCAAAVADIRNGTLREQADNDCGDFSEYTPEFNNYQHYPEPPADPLPDFSNRACFNSDFWTKLTQSYNEARNQVAKFTKRKEFLDQLKSQAQNVYNVFNSGQSQISTFLNHPAVLNVINKRASHVSIGGFTPNPYVSNTVIYLWQDEAEDPADRLLHIVRVDARIPTKCGGGSCGVPDANGNFTASPAWPKIKTYSKNWDTERCYKMENTSGAVKMRVIRFDEPRGASSLLFPNGQPIWQFRQGHMDANFQDNIDAIKNYGNCEISSNYIPQGLTPAQQDIYYRAFLMNKRTDSAVCWDAANALLETGISSETCAQYYMADIDVSVPGGNAVSTTPRIARQGMSLKFLSCGDGDFD